MGSAQAAIALTRFGMGAKPGEITAIGKDARDWLEAQLQQPQTVQVTGENLASADEIAGDLIRFTRKTRQMRKTDSEQAQSERRSTRRTMAARLAADIAARNTQATTTDKGFLERWVRFWSNHFTVSARKRQTIGLVGPFEREVIRARAFGTFEDLLKAATLHSAMLMYLDNHRSIGPSTRIAKRRKLGLNENLAREVMELHTLGVGGGYSQDDVEAFAKTLTGWTIAAPPLRQTGLGKVVFEPRMHEPGRHSILDKSYKDDGAEQAKSVLKDLAGHPSTARHVAVKLARHFVSDQPPAHAIQVLEQTFLETGGDLSELARAVIHLDEAWKPEAQKLKTPEELLISSARMLGGYAVFGGARDLRKIYASLGQSPFGAPSPEGWPDTAGEWAGPDAIKKRLEWAHRAAQRGQSRIAASDFLDEALGALASDATRISIARAESNAQGLTLAIMSPEFQRR